MIIEFLINAVGIIFGLIFTWFLFKGIGALLENEELLIKIVYSVFGIAVFLFVFIGVLRPMSIYVDVRGEMSERCDKFTSDSKNYNIVKRIPGGKNEICNCTSIKASDYYGMRDFVGDYYKEDIKKSSFVRKGEDTEFPYEIINAFDDALELCTRN